MAVRIIKGNSISPPLKLSPREAASILRKARGEQDAKPKGCKPRRGPGYKWKGLGGVKEG